MQNAYQIGGTKSAVGIYRKLVVNKDKPQKRNKKIKNWGKSPEICEYLLIGMIISNA